MKIRRMLSALSIIGVALVASTGTAQASTARPGWFSGDCATDMRWPGNVGVINAQFNSVTRSLQWNVTNYDTSTNSGRWIADVYVGKRRVDHKDQDYNPHGSVSPVDMRAGRRLSFVIQHFDNQGKVSFSDPSAGCDIP